MKRNTQRPCTVTILSGAAVGLILYGLGRAFQAVSRWSDLSIWNSYLPFYLVLSGGMVAFMGVFAAWALWQGRWRRLLLGVGILISIFYWVERGLFWRWEERFQGALFAAGLNVLALGMLLIILNRSTIRAYFEERYGLTQGSDIT